MSISRGFRGVEGTDPRGFGKQGSEVSCTDPPNPSLYPPRPTPDSVPTDAAAALVAVKW